MFDIDSEQIYQYEKTLKAVADRAIPIAVEKTLEDTGQEGRNQALKIIPNKMVLRNKHPLLTTRIDKSYSKNKDINKKKVILGNSQDYMAMQELGGVKKSKGKGVAIPTASASGEGNIARPKKRLPKAANLFNQVRINRRSVTANKKQRNVTKVKQAKANGDKFVYLDTSKSKGIYRVTGTKKRPKIKMIWDLSRRSYHIKPNPWLLPASKIAVGKQPAMYKARLEYQLRRLGFKT
jgi:hypothetical protein